MLAGSSSNSWPRLLGSSIMKYSTDKSSKLYYKHKNSPMFMENVWSIVFSLQLFTIFILSYCKTRLVLCMRAIQDVTDDQWLAQYDSWLRLIVWNTLRRFENSLASVKVDFPSAWASCPEHVSKNNEHICPRSTVHPFVPAAAARSEPTKLLTTRYLYVYVIQMILVPSLKELGTVGRTCDQL
jgi:hypothetical protein